MSPNDTASTQLMCLNHADTRVKPVMDTIHSPSDLTHATSTTSASAPLDAGPPPIPPLQSGNRNMQELDMKKEADLLRTYERWPVYFMEKRTYQLLDFSSQTGKMWFVVHSVEWRLGGGSKEMTPSGTISFGANLVGSSMGS